MPSGSRSRPWGLSLKEVIEHYGWDEVDECWIWLGPKHRQGYGAIEFKGKGLRVTRVVYELRVGPVGNLHVLHRCDRPERINPDHLFLGTQADNNADMRAKGRERHRIHRGEAAPWSKLTAPQVERIRSECAEGRTQRSVASQFGITQSHVSDIVRQKIWRTAA